MTTTQDIAVQDKNESASTSTQESTVETKAPAAQESTQSIAKPETTEVAAKPDAINAEGLAAAKADAKDKAPTPTQEIDLKVEKGSLISEDHLAEIKALAKEKGMTQEQADLLLKREEAAIVRREQAVEAELQAKKVFWAEESKKDPEIGGDRFSESVTLAQRFLESQGTPKLMDFLDKSGLGSNVEVIRIFARAGKLMSNDRLVQPGTTSVRSRSFEDMFYGGKNQ